MGSSSGDTGRIAIDAMSGDMGPAEVVAAVKLAFEKQADLNPLTLVGDEAVLRPLLQANGLQHDPRIALFHASEVITMDDKPMQALKRKKDSSMIRAIELVKEGQAAAVVSCGNTGALLAAGTLKLRPMEGVGRAALGAIVPRQDGHFVLIDAGANPEAKAEHLVHNAILGSNFARVMLGIERPRVGLITIGTEEGKGNALISSTHELLKRTSDIVNYVGPIEGFQVFTNHVDVVVCDGFVGNILLKSWESLVKFFRTMLKEEMTATPIRSIGAFLAKGASKGLKDRINPERYNGAPLLGLNGNILKAHGSANRYAIRSAILAASELLKADMIHRIESDIARANELIAAPVVV